MSGSGTGQTGMAGGSASMGVHAQQIPNPALVSGRPVDWPRLGGPLDLSTHDKPHASSGIEWWYFHSHLKGSDGKEYAAFGSFFRAVIGKDKVTGGPKYGHFLTWGITDATKMTCYPYSSIEGSFKDVLLDRLERGEGSKDPRIRRSLAESLRRGMPMPDRELTGEISVAPGELNLAYAGSTFVKENDGRYHVTLHGKDASCDLWLSPMSKPHLHGKDGVVPGREGEEMFYYFMPKLAVEGSLEIKGVATQVKGSGWYDHEFGGHRRHSDGSGTVRMNVAWNWCGVQLADGSAITVYELKDITTGEDAGTTAVLVLPSGEEKRTSTISLTPTRMWHSIRTFETYPVSWTLRSAEIGVNISIDAIVDDQELITVLSKPSFWEGQCRVSGQVGGQEVSGMAYVERSGFSTLDTLDDFFKAVSIEVRRSVANLLPLEPTREEAIKLFAHEGHEHLLEGLDEKEIANALIAPIRTITDRGGKAWRSYAALACTEALGADCRPYARWLSLPEILHSGSLIVDDVEDRSTVRRGGLPAHLMFGEPLAINSGTAAYFLAEGTAMKTDAPDNKQIRLYSLYFEGLRAGHAGQALDIAGVDSYLEEARTTGEVLKLEWRILGMYRLKTGAPAGILARMGAVAADGTPDQVERLGRFFEELGVAFQIVDDVLNLRGFEGGLKDAGEDITAGKVTLPVAIALGKLELTERTGLVETLRSHTHDPNSIRAVISVLEDSGALEECNRRAKAMVEDSWNSVQSLLPESLWKVMLRAFSWYVLERHY